MKTQDIIKRATILLPLGLSFFFLYTGWTKIVGMEFQIRNFLNLGLPLWFMYVTGFIEMAGGLLLVVPTRRFYGAVILSGTMGGAILTQIIAGEPVMALVPLVFLFLSLATAWLLRPQWLRTFLCRHSLTRHFESCEQA